MSKSIVRVPPNHKAHSTYWRTSAGKARPVTVRKFSDAYSRGELDGTGSVKLLDMGEY